MRVQRLKQSSKNLKNKVTKKSTNGFDINNKSCYTLGVAYGVCGLRTMDNRACEDGTNFVIPTRCRGDGKAKQGIQDGIALKQALINVGVYK